MNERNIYIVDDDKYVAQHIVSYEMILRKIKASRPEIKDIAFKFDYSESIEDAKEKLSSGRVVDVLIIDYRFTNSNEDGGKLIDYIRKEINKHCRIIFYTINGLEDIPNGDFVSLINNHIFKIVDKARTEDEDFVNIIVEAALDCDPIVLSLERFWNEYRALLSTYKYSFMGESLPFDKVIEHIRMDDEIGRSIIEKMLHKAIISSVSL